MRESESPLAVPSVRRRWLLVIWLLAPLALAAWHIGPGQRGLQRDAAAASREAARAAAGRQDWSAALDADHAALAALAAADAPADGETAASAPRAPTAAANALALDEARAHIAKGELAEGLTALTDLLPRIAADPAQGGLAQRARHELAAASYQAAWVMRLEGAAPEEWGIEAEAARQHFRMLAESDDQALAAIAGQNLEATVRLQRMDLSELKGLALPKNCGNCKNLSQRRRQQRESRCEKPGAGKQEQPKPADAREQIKQQTRGAGLQARGEGAGS